MSAEHDLQNAFQEWQRLAEAEGAAIQASHWTQLADCQHALLQLQSRISHLTALAREEWTLSGANRAEKETQRRSVVNALIAQEQRNQALLSATQEAAQEEFGIWKAASQTLQRLRRSYAPARPAAWTTFS